MTNAEHHHWTHSLARPAGAVLVIALAGIALYGALGRSHVGPPPTVALSTVSSTQLDLNTATAAQLQLLPGVGPAIAQRIVDDRDARGPYRTIRDLDRVKGVGPRTLERLRPHLSISPAR